MASSSKRSFKEMEVVCIEGRNFHGVVVGDVSPVKESRRKAGVKYFDAMVSDKKKLCVMVSFEPKLRVTFEKARESGEGIAISN